MIRLGFSPCPNDAFIFHAIANKKIGTRGFDFELVIEDVETLNRLAVKKEIDVTKVSCHAYCHMQDEYSFLRSGGALGRGCGPLIVAKDFCEPEALDGRTVAVPGNLTTAFLLCKLFASSLNLHPSAFVEMPFHEIMGAVGTGRVGAGLIIHEGRFTYRGYGLQQVADLGEWWERETGLPIPLGGIIARKALGQPALQNIEELIRESIRYSREHRDEAMSYIKRHARELSEQVINNHIALYVNDYTIDMGDDGMAALEALLNRAKSACYTGR